MAITTAQTFYTAQADHDGTWGTDVRQLDATAVPAGEPNSQNNHGTAATTNSITYDPYTVRSTTGDASTLFGWAINALAASDDGMGSAVGARRIIPAGTWNLGGRINIPIAGTTTGSLTVTLTFYIIRVSSDGLTRTLLFSATTGSAASTGLAAANNQDLSVNPVRSEIILEAGETLHVAIVSNCTQVAGLLGATVQGSIVLQHSSNVTFVRVPTPGIRTSYTSNAAATAAAVTGLVRKTGKTLTTTAAGVAVMLRLIGIRLPVSGTAVASLSRYMRLGAMVVTGATSASKSLKVSLARPTSALAVASTLKRLYKTVAVSGTAVAVFTRMLEAFRAFTVSMTAQAGFLRAVISARSFSTAVTAVTRLTLKFGQDALNRITGGSTVVRGPGMIFVRGKPHVKISDPDQYI